MSITPFSLYVHIPFCSQKCPYCDFNTYAVPRAPEEAYVAALQAELRTAACDSRFAGRPIQSVFFGGGTPSLISPDGIRRIVESACSIYPLQVGAEVTLEANPSEPSQERYEGYRAAGINRVSFGVQSFDERRLSLLGRDHTPDDARRAVAAAVAAGIENVSVDIIFGTPGQALDELKGDISSACSLPITHISTYSLTIEPGTPFYQRQERGLLSLPPEDTVAEMLSLIPKLLSEKGFSRYEISNYAKPGLESFHNRAYWLGDDYLGIGAGAHSCVTQREGTRRVSAERWSTYALPTTYMERAHSGDTVSWRESLSREALMFEFFYLGLRRTAGVSREQFRLTFGEEIGERHTRTIAELVADGFIIEREGFLVLSERGIALSDSVYERLA
jgi:oxygen-independent coproporphyrinogen-3 oxidase